MARSLYNRDPLRPGLDPTGFIPLILSRSPLPNWFESGDGLNTAGYRFVRHTKGIDGASGDGVDVQRDQYNLRVDYNINPTHKLFGTLTRERVPTEGNPPPFPDSPFIGRVLREPQVYTVSFVSSLSATVLNEVRVGFKRGKHLLQVPYTNPDNPVDELFPLINRGRRADGAPGNYPAASMPASVCSGIACTRTPGGSLSWIFSTRPGSRTPAWRQSIDARSTPYSCCRSPRT